MGDPEQDFRERWSWKVTIDDLSDGNPLISEYWYSQPYIMFLNELAFRKERNHARKNNKTV